MLRVKEILVLAFHVVAKEIGGFQLFKEPPLGAGQIPAINCINLRELCGQEMRTVLPR